MNNFTQLVRVGRDAEIRYTQAGKPVTGFSAAYDVGYGDNKRTEWIDCSWWGERGTKVAEYIKKGSQLVVQGTIGTKEYEGKVRLALDLSDVTLVGGKPEGSAGSGGSRGGAPQRERPQKATDSAGDDFADEDIPFLSQRGNF